MQDEQAVERVYKMSPEKRLAERDRKRAERARLKEKKDRAEQESNSTLAQLLRKANPSAKESDEELVEQFLKVHRENAPLEFPESPTVIINGKREHVFERDGVHMYWANVNHEICHITHVMLPVTETAKDYEDRIRRVKARQNVAL